jgi:hypothetical protein
MQERFRSLMQEVQNLYIEEGLKRKHDAKEVQQVDVKEVQKVDGEKGLKRK